MLTVHGNVPTWMVEKFEDISNAVNKHILVHDCGRTIIGPNEYLQFKASYDNFVLLQCRGIEIEGYGWKRQSYYLQNGGAYSYNGVPGSAFVYTAAHQGIVAYNDFGFSLPNNRTMADEVQDSFHNFILGVVQSWIGKQLVKNPTEFMRELPSYKNHAMISAIDRVANSHMNEYNASLERNSDTIQELESSLAKEYTRLANLRKNAPKPIDTTSIIEEIKKITEFDIVPVDGLTLHMTTRNPQLLKVGNSFLPIGKVRFVLYMENGGIVAEPVEFPVGCGATPHSGTHGNMCWGGFGATGIKALTTMKFRIVADVLLAWIQSYNTSSLMQAFAEWGSKRGLILNEGSWLAKTYEPLPEKPRDEPQVTNEQNAEEAEDEGEEDDGSPEIIRPGARRTIPQQQGETVFTTGGIRAAVAAAREAIEREGENATATPRNQ